MIKVFRQKPSNYLRFSLSLDVVLLLQFNRIYTRFFFTNYYGILLVYIGFYMYGKQRLDGTEFAFSFNIYIYIFLSVNFYARQLVWIFTGLCWDICVLRCFIYFLSVFMFHMYRCEAQANSARGMDFCLCTKKAAIAKPRAICLSGML